MATVFRDKDTGEILRIDYGKPIPEFYAQKEGLENWVSEEITNEDAKLLIPEGPAIPIDPEDLKAAWAGAKTIDEKLEILAKKSGLK
jgi:hypothetical protein